MKAEHKHPTRLLQSLPIPEWKWEHIIMDFMIGLLNPTGTRCCLGDCGLLNEVGILLTDQGQL